MSLWQAVLFVIGATAALAVIIAFFWFAFWLAVLLFGWAIGSTIGALLIVFVIAVLAVWGLSNLD